MFREFPELAGLRSEDPELRLLKMEIANVFTDEWTDD
jgi:hypothetical protein